MADASDTTHVTATSHNGLSVDCTEDDSVGGSGESESLDGADGAEAPRAEALETALTDTDADSHLEARPVAPATHGPADAEEMSGKPQAQPAEILMTVMRGRLAHWDAAKGDFAEGWQSCPQTLQDLIIHAHMASRAGEQVAKQFVSLLLTPAVQSAAADALGEVTEPLLTAANYIMRHSRNDACDVAMACSLLRLSLALDIPSTLGRHGRVAFLRKPKNPEAVLNGMLQDETTAARERKAAGQPAGGTPGVPLRSWECDAALAQAGLLQLDHVTYAWGRGLGPAMNLLRFMDLPADLVAAIEALPAAALPQYFDFLASLMRRGMSLPVIQRAALQRAQKLAVTHGSTAEAAAGQPAEDATVAANGEASAHPAASNAAPDAPLDPPPHPESVAAVPSGEPAATAASAAETSSEAPLDTPLHPESAPATPSGQPAAMAVSAAEISSISADSTSAGRPAPAEAAAAADAANAVDRALGAAAGGSTPATASANGDSAAEPTADSQPGANAPAASAAAPAEPAASSSSSGGAAVGAAIPVAPEDAAPDPTAAEPLQAAGPTADDTAAERTGAVAAINAAAQASGEAVVSGQRPDDTAPASDATSASNAANQEDEAAPASDAASASNVAISENAAAPASDAASAPNADIQEDDAAPVSDAARASIADIQEDDAAPASDTASASEVDIPEDAVAPVAGDTGVSLLSPAASDGASISGMAGVASPDAGSAAKAPGAATAATPPAVADTVTAADDMPAAGSASADAAAAQQAAGAAVRVHLRAIEAAEGSAAAVAVSIFSAAAEGAGHAAPSPDVATSHAMTVAQEAVSATSPALSDETAADSLPEADSTSSDAAAAKEVAAAIDREQPDGTAEADAAEVPSASAASAPQAAADGSSPVAVCLHILAPAEGSTDGVIVSIRPVETGAAAAEAAPADGGAAMAGCAALDAAAAGAATAVVDLKQPDGEVAAVRLHLQIPPEGSAAGVTVRLQPVEAEAEVAPAADHGSQAVAQSTAAASQASVSDAYAWLLPAEKGSGTLSGANSGALPAPAADAAAAVPGGKAGLSAPAAAGKPVAGAASCSICGWQGEEIHMHFTSESHLECCRKKGLATCTACGIHCSGSLKNLEAHKLSSRHAARLKLLDGAAASAPALAPPPGLQQPRQPLSSAAAGSAAGDEVTSCGGKMLTPGVFGCAVCHWKGPPAGVIQHFTSQEHLDKCAVAARKCSVCVQCGTTAPRRAASAVDKHQHGKSHRDRVAFLRSTGSQAAASDGQAAAATALGDGAASAAAAAPVPSQTAPELATAAAKLARTAVAECGIGCVICQLQGLQSPAHFKSAEHKARCAEWENGIQRVCYDCGKKFPNPTHLKAHLGHPKHAAWAAWLGGKAPAAIKAAASVAAMQVAAARQAGLKPLTQQVHPQQPSQQEPHAAPQQVPAEQPPAAQAAAAASASRPASAAAVPAGFVRGCGICGLAGDLPATHFSGAEHSRKCKAAGRHVCAACAEAFPDAEALTAHNRSPGHYRRVGLIRRHQSAEISPAAVPALGASLAAAVTGSAAAAAAAAAAARALSPALQPPQAAAAAQLPSSVGSQSVRSAGASAPPGRLAGSAIAAAAQERQAPPPTGTAAASAPAHASPAGAPPLTAGRAAANPARGVTVLQRPASVAGSGAPAAASSAAAPPAAAAAASAAEGVQPKPQGECRVCRWSGSSQAALAHFQSSEHLAKCITAGANVCSDCGVRCVSRYQLKEHRQGLKHLAHVAALSAAVRQRQQGATAAPLVSPRPQQPAARPAARAAAGGQPQQPGQLDAHPTAAAVRCDICRWSVGPGPTSTRNAVDHFQSVRHLEACRSGGHFCSPCGLRLSSLVDLHPHRLTTEHLQRVAWLKAAREAQGAAERASAAVQAAQAAERTASGSQPASPAAPAPAAAVQPASAVPRAMQAAAQMYAEQQWQQQQQQPQQGQPQVGQMQQGQKQQGSGSQSMAQQPASPIAHAGASGSRVLTTPRGAQQQQAPAPQYQQAGQQVQPPRQPLPGAQQFQPAAQQVSNSTAGTPQHQQYQQPQPQQQPASSGCPDAAMQQALAAQEHQLAQQQRMRQQRQQVMEEQQAREQIMQQQFALRQMSQRQQGFGLGQTLQPFQQSQPQQQAAHCGQQQSQQAPQPHQQPAAQYGQQQSQLYGQQPQSSAQYGQQQPQQAAQYGQQAAAHLGQQQRSAAQQAPWQDAQSRAQAAAQRPAAMGGQWSSQQQGGLASQPQPQWQQAHQQRQQTQQTPAPLSSAAAQPSQQPWELSSALLSAPVDAASMPLPQHRTTMQQMAPALPTQQRPPAHPAASMPLVQLPPLWDLAAETEDVSPVSSPKRQPAPVADGTSRAHQPAPQHLSPAADRKQPAAAAAAAVAAVAAEPLSDFICPITHCIFKDPVICADGFTYERTAIVDWFQRSGNSPMTNEPLEHKGLVPNRALKNLIAATALLEQQRLS